jgi:toxin ParE1/3/4
VRIVFTAAAEADFESIGDFIAADNPGRAVSFVQELRQACEGLASFPSRFPLAENLEAVGIRRRSYRRYAIFYRVDEDRVVILRIVHGSRELDDESFTPAGTS